MRRVLALSICVTGVLGGLLAAAPVSDATLSIPGLEQPVEILRDHWGLNHIYARTEHDLFFAQGYSAPHDRLFQFEMWRRQATGTVAEILGRKELKRDVGTRLHRFRGDLKSELNWYHPRGEAIITAYVAGVNAAIAEAMKQAVDDAGRVPHARHHPVAVDARRRRFRGTTRCSSTSTRNCGIAQAVRILGAEQGEGTALFPGRRSEHHSRPGDRSFVAQRFHPRIYNAFRRPVMFGAGAPSEPPSALELSERSVDIGSNNWVVSGRLTASGYPMMMNDPHRTQSIPSLRYWVHLVGPGWNVIGGGEPVLPGCVDRAQRIWCLGADDLRLRHGRSLRLRNQPVQCKPVPLSWHVGGHAHRQGQRAGQRRGAGCRRLEVHASRAGVVGGSGASQSVCAARRVDGTWWRAVFGEPTDGPGKVLARVRRGVHFQPYPCGKHGLGGSGGKHRVSGGRRDTAAAELVRPRAGAGRRPL